MRFTQLDAWLRWLETLHPKAIDLGLERVQAVARRLDLTFSIPVITVAGTNGKGSCVALLDAMLSAEGKQVGCYTSPHLRHYNERVKIAGELASDHALCQAFAAVDEARGETTLSYFEFGTLAALWLFKRAELDVLVLEVGLGGRLDAVNIIDADIAIVSSVALDHEAWLGSDRDVIGREKAGVFRPGKPAVFGDPQPLPALEQQAEQAGVALHCRHRDFDFIETEQGWNWWGQGRAGRLELNDLPKPSLLLDNAASCIQALQSLPFSVSRQAIEQGLRTARVAARQQRLTVEGIDCWLDVAHNPAAVDRLVAALRSYPATGKTWAVLAVMADKSVDELLPPCLPLVDEWLLPPLPDNPRALPAGELANKLEALGQRSLAQPSVHNALAHALNTLTGGDRLLIFGSFFTVAEALEYFYARYPEAVLERQ